MYTKVPTPWNIAYNFCKFCSLGRYTRCNASNVTISGDSDEAGVSRFKDFRQIVE